jgi:hypothetical protein
MLLTKSLLVLFLSLISKVPELETLLPGRNLSEFGFGVI